MKTALIWGGVNGLLCLAIVLAFEDVDWKWAVASIVMFFVLGAACGYGAHIDHENGEEGW